MSELADLTSQAYSRAAQAEVIHKELARAIGMSALELTAEEFYELNEVWRSEKGVDLEENHEDESYGGDS